LQEGHNQRCERDPGEDIDSGERKNEHLQERRQKYQQPGAEMNLPHREG
jgi:hypothetical protein